MPEKILAYDQIVATARSLRAQSRTIVHCHGVYDLLHVGHIKHLEAARRLGHVLIVTITPDRFVNKGAHRPAFTESLRAEALAALTCVDYVAINTQPDAVGLIKDLQPHVYVKGTVPGNGKRDHTDAIVLEEEAVRSVGGKLVLTDEATYSASTLINRFLDVFTPEARAFLAEFRKRYTPERIVADLQAMRQLKVLIIGETIIDEYVFCDAMGRTNKEAVLVVGENRTERYPGGILAIANHLSGFCGETAVLSALGQPLSHADFVSDGLAPAVTRQFVTASGVPTMVKRRYIEEYLGHKLFEVYNTKAVPLEGADEEAFLERLDALVPQYDVVIVADYGHGLLTERAIARVCERARFLAVNTQTNAGNLGFHVISKYPRADFIAIAEPEVRLQHRDHNGPLEKLTKDTAAALGARRVIVTRGKRGCLCYDVEDGFADVPAMAIKIVDRVGSGDALLALGAPAAAMRLPLDLVGFIGNVAGAEACAVMGNRAAIEPTSFFRHVTSLLM